LDFLASCKSTPTMRVICRNRVTDEESLDRLLFILLKDDSPYSKD
jgi:hypothetical protein